MKYQNTKTKIIIDVSSKIHGDNWIKLGELPNQPPKKNDEKQEDTLDNEPETDNVPKGINKAQIMQELDAFGIKYDSNAKKEILYDLMMKGKK